MLRANLPRATETKKEEEEEDGRKCSLTQMGLTELALPPLRKKN